MIRSIISCYQQKLVIPTDGIENQVYMENNSFQGMVMLTGGVENQLYTEINKLYMEK